MDRETAITRALAAFWREIETIYPQPFYEGISEGAFTNLREAASQAVAERIDRVKPTRDGLLQKHWGEYTPRIVQP